MPENTSRRAFLAAAGTAVSGALAGCLGGEQPPLEPRVPQQALREDGWRQVDSFEERAREEIDAPVVQPTVEIHSKGKMYANPRPIERATQQFDVDEPPFQPPAAQFMAAKAETDPPLHRLTGVSNTLNEQLIDQLEQQAMSEIGSGRVRNVRRVDEGELDIEEAGEAVHRRYRAEAVYPEDQTEINGQPVTVESGTFELEAQLAMWPYEGLLAVSGGAYPGESGTIELSPRDQTREFDLELQPQYYRESVRELITLVS